MKQLALLILFAASFTTIVYAQNTGGNPTLAAFDALRSGDHVVVQWTIRSGFSCASVNVLHSTDSINFTSIYEYPGICGASAQDEPYSFTHTGPVSGRNYYKLDMGSFGTSAIVLVELTHYGIAGFVINGEPGKPHKVYFSNPSNAVFSLELYTLDGRLLHSNKNIEGDQSELPAFSGTFDVIVLRLTGNDGTTYVGKYLN